MWQSGWRPRLRPTSQDDGRRCLGPSQSKRSVNSSPQVPLTCQRTVTQNAEVHDHDSTFSNAQQLLGHVFRPTFPFLLPHMAAAGILFLPLDLWAKGYLAMGALMLTQSGITLTKTLRDNHEAADTFLPDRRCPDRAVSHGSRENRRTKPSRYPGFIESGGLFSRRC